MIVTLPAIVARARQCEQKVRVDMEQAAAELEAMLRIYRVTHGVEPSTTARREDK